ncbi:hypothetical protein [Methylovirgula sp. 4M-Z18]
MDSTPVVAGCETAEVLEPVEAALDAISLSVSFRIIRDNDLARAL